MGSILIVGDNLGASRQKLFAGRKKHHAVVKSWSDFKAGQISDPTIDGKPDIVVMDMAAVEALPIEKTLNLRRQDPDLRLFYVMDILKQVRPSTIEALSQPGVTWASSQASDEELGLRILGLFSSAERTQRLREKKTAGSSRFDYLMPELHNPKSGRLDAACIADWFGLPLKTLATVLMFGYARVHKTPDAVALQVALKVFLRIASALAHISGSNYAAKVWLNAPNPELENNQTPLSAIEAGEQIVIAEMLEDMIVGQPA